MIHFVKQGGLRLQCLFQLGGALTHGLLESILVRGHALFGALAVRNVEQRREKELQFPAIVGNRTDVEGVPEGRPVLAIVEDVDTHIGATRNGAANPLDGCRVGLGTLQQTAVPADDLVPFESGQVQEGIVREDDRIIGAARVRDDHRHAGGANGGSERIAPAMLGMEVVRHVPSVG